MKHMLIITCFSCSTAPRAIPLWAGRTAGEREPYEVAVLLSRVEPGGEVVSGVQASSLEQGLLETIELLQEALTKALEPYWRDPARLRSLAGFSWWLEAIESLGHQCP